MMVKTRISELFNRLLILLDRNTTWLLWFLFVLIYAYLFARSFTVFYNNDELVSKWIYMIQWNFLPYEGFFDTNNHFLNSFLGGFFYRVFGFEHIAVFRLGNLLSFPLFYWSIVGFKRFFKLNANFWFFLIGLVCSSFVIEFFGMARGYGLSMAFMLLAIYQSFVFFNSPNFFRGFLILLAWFLAVYSNLTLLPFGILGTLFVFVLGAKNGLGFWLLLLTPFLYPLYFAVNYSFDLSSGGKLYTGGSDGFFSVTVKSIAHYNWNNDSMAFVVLLSGVFAFIIFRLFYDIFKLKQFQKRLIFPLLLVLSVLSAYAQNILFGVNFPDDRVALYFVPFFIGALSFSLDAIQNRFVAALLSIATVMVFVADINTKYFKVYNYDYLDMEIFEKIPPYTKGIPTTTASYRNFAMDDELSRTYNLPIYPFLKLDTLSDYILLREQDLKEYAEMYTVILEDKISGNFLLKRNKFLNRTLIRQDNIGFETNGLYHDFLNDSLEGNVCVRVKGFFEEVSLQDEIVLNYKTESRNGEVYYYQAIFLNSSCQIGPNGKIEFDFSVPIVKADEAEILKVFLHNKQLKKFKGNIEISTYRLK